MTTCRSPSAARSQDARSDRPMRRWISCVRPDCFPLAASRSVRVCVERGSIPYSAVTQPRPLPFTWLGTRSSAVAVQRTRVRPNAQRTLPSACSVKPVTSSTRRSSSIPRPCLEGISRPRTEPGGRDARSARRPDDAYRVVRGGGATTRSAADRPTGDGRGHDMRSTASRLLGVLSRLDLRLDVRLARRLEPHLGVHLQRDAGEELPDLAPKRLALEEPADFLGDDPGHLTSRLVRLREQERERVLGKLHVRDEVPDSLLGHEERADPGEYRAAHDFGNEPFRRNVFRRQLVVRFGHGAAPRRRVNFASASFDSCPFPLVARNPTVTSSPFVTRSSSRTSSIRSVPRVASRAIPWATKASGSETARCVCPARRSSSAPSDRVFDPSSKSTARWSFKGSSTSLHRFAFPQRRFESWGPPPQATAQAAIASDGKGLTCASRAG